MKRDIICNTGPIPELAIIGRLDLLRDLFDNVFVPEEVHDEILEGGVKGVGLGSWAVCRTGCPIRSQSILDLCPLNYWQLQNNLSELFPT